MQNFFVTGWHHSGTTILQHCIADQLNINTTNRLPESINKNFDSIKNNTVHKCPASCGPVVPEYMKKLYENKEKHNIHVVIILRDANDLLESIKKRAVMTSSEAEAKAYLQFLIFVKNTFIKKYDNYTIISLSDFVLDPLKQLKRTGLIITNNDSKYLSKKETLLDNRPEDNNKTHNKLRQWQVNQKIDPNIVKHSQTVYPHSKEINEIHNELLNNQIRN